MLPALLAWPLPLHPFHMLGAMSFGNFATHVAHAIIHTLFLPIFFRSVTEACASAQQKIVNQMDLWADSDCSGNTTMKCMYNVSNQRDNLE